MPAYLIVQVEITDPLRFREYLAESPLILARYGGRCIVRAGETVTLEGPENTRRIVIIEFPSLDVAKKWYHSEEYQRIKPLREGAANGSLIAVEGC